MDTITVKREDRERELPGGGIIHDRRTPEERAATIGYIVGTDRFLSGWGRAPGRSLFAIPVRTQEEWTETLQFMEGRGDMLRVRECGRDYRPRLFAGDHLSIRHPRSAATSKCLADTNRLLGEKGTS